MKKIKLTGVNYFNKDVVLLIPILIPVVIDGNSFELSFTWLGYFLGFRILKAWSMDIKYDLEGLSTKELFDRRYRVKGYVMQSRIGSDDYKHDHNLLVQIDAELKRRESAIGTTYPPWGSYPSIKRKLNKSRLFKIEVIFSIILIILVGYCSYHNGYEKGFDDCAIMFINK